MYNITNNTIVQRIESLCRTWRVWIEDESGEVFTGETIMDSQSTAQTTADADDIQLGAICAAGWKINVWGVGGSWLGKKIKLSLFLAELGQQTTYGSLDTYSWGRLSALRVSQIPILAEILEGELIPMGDFTVVRVLRNGDMWELTVYDKLYFADKVFDRSLLPSRLTASALEQAVLSQLELESQVIDNGSGRLTDNESRKLRSSDNYYLSAADFDFTVITSRIPVSSTCRQILSWIASAHGQFGLVDRFGRYCRKWYGAPVKELDPNTIDQPTLSEKANTIVGMVCTVDNTTTLTIGKMQGGRVLEFENPFMSADLLRSIFTQIRNYTWFTARVYMRLADPRLDPGDTVSYIDPSGSVCGIPVTDLAFRFDGGLSADITAAGISVEEQIEL